MDLKSLIECSYATDVTQKGTHIQFNTLLYSSDEMKFSEVTIKCPISGDFILTECAQIVGRENDEETKTVLKNLFVTLEEASQIQNKIKNEDSLIYTPLELSIMEASRLFINENLETLPTKEEEKEDIKFKFLAICSKIFSKVYEHNKNKKQQ